MTERVLVWVPFQYATTLRSRNGRLRPAAPFDRAPLMVRALKACDVETAFVERTPLNGHVRELRWVTLGGDLFRPMTGANGEPFQTAEDAFQLHDGQRTFQDHHETPYWPFRIHHPWDVQDFRSRKSIQDDRSITRFQDDMHAHELGRVQARADEIILVDGRPYARPPRLHAPDTFVATRYSLNVPGEPVWTVGASGHGDQIAVHVGVDPQGAHRSGEAVAFRADRRDEALAFASRYAEALGCPLRIDDEANIESHVEPVFDENIDGAIRAWEQAQQALRHVSVYQLGIRGMEALTRSHAAVKAAIAGDGASAAFSALTDLAEVLRGIDEHYVREVFAPTGTLRILAFRYGRGDALEPEIDNDFEAIGMVR